MKTVRFNNRKSPQVGIGRRGFVLGLGAGATALVGPFFDREVSAQSGAPPPMRLLVIQTPDGRPPDTWMPQGADSDFTLQRGFAPFQPLKDDLVVLSGVDCMRSAGEPHCQSMVAWMTGVTPHESVKNYTAARSASFDQAVAKEPAIHGGTRFQSLQFAGDMRTAPQDRSHKILSWAGDDQPKAGTHNSMEVYQQLFDGFMPSADGDQQEQVAQLIARRRSVLDLVEKDWNRMSASVPLAQRPGFDAHLEAIRSLEKGLENLAAEPSGAGCEAPEAGSIPENDNYPLRYRSNLEMTRLAFACDISRVVSFMSAPTTSNLRHKPWIPDMDSGDHHHNRTHAGAINDLEKIGTFYATNIASFIQSLKDTPDGDGSLLDHTVVLYMSELGYGHDPKNIPIVFFGNANGRIETGRYLNFMNARRSTNDVWVSIAQMLGLDWESFGDADKNRGAVPGLVTA